MDKRAPNFLTVNENVITNKNCIDEIFKMTFLLTLLQILYLRSQKEKDLLIHIYESVLQIHFSLIPFKNKKSRN